MRQRRATPKRRQVGKKHASQSVTFSLLCLYSTQIKQLSTILFYFNLSTTFQSSILYIHLIPSLSFTHSILSPSSFIHPQSSQVSRITYIHGSHLPRPLFLTSSCHQRNCSGPRHAPRSVCCRSHFRFSSFSSFFSFLD